MANVPLVFCDTETTGLSYDKQVWEVAMIRDNPDGTTERDEFYLDVNVTDFGPFEFSEEAKEYNHWERYYTKSTIVPGEAIRRIDHMFRDRAHFIGMVPDFDANALWKIIRHAEGSRAGFPWYYQLIDVDMIALGYFRNEYNNAARHEVGPFKTSGWEGLTSLPVDTDAVSKYFDIEISEADRHTAMGDTIWTRKIFYALMGKDVPNG